MITRRTFICTSALTSAGLVLGACGRKTAPSSNEVFVLPDPTRENGFNGRWFRKEVNGVSCAVSTAPGAYFSFAVDGTERLEMIFEPMNIESEPYWAFQIDAGDPVRQPISKRGIVLPDAAQHEVRIVFDGTDECANRWTDELGLALAGIEASTGNISPIPSKSPLIAFYGDSITEGDCVLAAHTAPEHNSATHSYAWMLVNRLEADAYFAGYGSTGIGQAGTFAPAETAIDSLSANRRAEVPDVTIVIVEYGTNDIDASVESFAAGYTRVLQKLREMHPSATICCMIPFNQIRAMEIARVVADMQTIRESEQERIRCIETAGWDLSYTDGVHPDARSSAAAAQLIADELQAAQAVR